MLYILASHCMKCAKIDIPEVCTEGALALEVPDGALLQPPGGRVVDGVDVADEGDLGDVPGRDLGGGHHHDLAAQEHHRTVGGAGVVEHAGQQVHTRPEGLRTRVPAHRSRQYRHYHCLDYSKQ